MFLACVAQSVPCTISTEKTLVEKIKLNCLLTATERQVSVTIPAVDKEIRRQLLEAVKRDIVLAIEVFDEETSHSLKGGTHVDGRIKQFCGW